jgi:Outer membrane protein (OmpH-like).
LKNYQQKEAVLTDDAKQKEQQRLATLEGTLQQQQRQAQEDFSKKQQELIGPLLSAIQDAINAVAAEKQLTYVLNTTTSTGDVIILYASEEAQKQYDITEAVLAKLGI